MSKWRFRKMCVTLTIQSSNISISNLATIFWNKKQGQKDYNFYFFLIPYRILSRSTLHLPVQSLPWCRERRQARSGKSHFDTSTGLCPASPTFTERKRSVSLPQCDSAIKHSSPICFCNQLRNTRRGCDCTKGQGSPGIVSFNRPDFGKPLWTRSETKRRGSDVETQRERERLKDTPKSRGEEKEHMQWLSSAIHSSTSYTFSPFEHFSLSHCHSIRSSFSLSIPSRMRLAGGRFGSACPKLLSRSQIYTEKSTHTPAALPLVSKTTGVSNTKHSLVGQRGNVAWGTHIMVFHQSLKINTAPPNFPSDSCPTVTRCFKAALEKEQDGRLLWQRSTPSCRKLTIRGVLYDRKIMVKRK